MRYASLGGSAGLAMQYDCLALQSIQSIVPRFLPWSDSAMRPAAIQIVINDIYINRRKHGLEFGAGISTIFIAAMFARYGGELISIEHDDGWISQLKSFLTEDEKKVVSFVHAPIKKVRYKTEYVDWYDWASVQQALRDKREIDLVLVDGPPAYYSPDCLNRGPALAAVNEAIAQRVSIFLDDINRTGEQMIAKDWSNFLGCYSRELPVEAGLIYWLRGGTRNISQ